MLLLSDLPPAPPFDRWVLEQPVPLAAACLIAAFAVMVILQRRGDTKRGLIGGGVLVLVGVAVLATGMLIQTPRERLTRLTSEFIRRVFAADAVWAEATLADALVIASGGQVYDTFGKEQLVATIHNFGAFDTREWAERPRGSAIDGEGLGRTHSTIRVSAAYMGNQTIPSTWEFTWRRPHPKDSWQVTRIECLTMFGRPPRYNWERDARMIANSKPGAGGLKPDAF